MKWKHKENFCERVKWRTMEGGEFKWKKMI